MTRVGRAVRLLPIVVLFVLATSCNGFFLSNSAIQTVAVTPSAVLLSAAASSTTPGASYQLQSNSTTVGGTTADDTATATWSSSNSSAVTVDAGLITAVGTTATSSTSPITVTATDGGTASNAVDVLLYTVTTPTSLFLNGILPGATLPIGTYQLQAYFGTSTGFPLVTNFVTWTSDTPTAATVNTNGLVTVLSVVTPATVNITATASVGGTPTAANTVSGTVQFIAD